MQKNNVKIIWLYWGENFRWISFQLNNPFLVMPKYEKLSKGKRFGWLLLSLGTGIVSRYEMEKLNQMSYQNRIDKWRQS